MEKYAGQILLVTGPRGAGKTTLCRRVIEVAQQASWKVAGVLSPAIIRGGLKFGIGVEDLSSGKRFLLAKLPSQEDDVVEPEIRTEGWVFDQRCLRWSNTVLSKAVPCDLLVVDELGPLELEQKKGWTSGIKALESGQFHLGLAVVREELLNHLIKRWPTASVITIHDPQEIDHLLDKIIELLVDLQGFMGAV
jgi:nucleoside-triphosphatase THEP1